MMTSIFYGTGQALPERRPYPASWTCGRCGAQHHDTLAFCAHCLYPCEQYEAGYANGREAAAGRISADHYVLLQRARTYARTRADFKAAMLDPNSGMLVPTAAAMNAASNALVDLLETLP